MDTKDTKNTRTQKTGGAGGNTKKDDGRKAFGRKLRQNWYEGQNREIVVYYLIAVAFLELIVGCVAFFYGVSPVGLMLILHLSGQFFSRSLDAVNGGGAKGDGDSGEVPERVQRFYNIMSHAPTVVILLGLLVIGACLFFLDSAMGALGSVGKVLSGYIPWILGCIAAFLVICYIARLYFLSRHRRMMQEYAYRMKVLETTGIIIASKGSEPLKLQDGRVVPALSAAAVRKRIPPGTGKRARTVLPPGRLPLGLTPDRARSAPRCFPWASEVFLRSPFLCPGKNRMAPGNEKPRGGTVSPGLSVSQTAVPSIMADTEGMPFPR